MIDLGGCSTEVAADWLELFAAVDASKPISKQMAVSLGETHFGLSANEISDAFSKVMQRHLSLGALYPFDCGENFIVSRPNALSTPYVALLQLSPSSPSRALDVWSLEAAAKAFEYLVEKCLHDFFGPRTQALNFGHPSEIGRPADFNGAVKWLAEKANLRLGANYRPPRRKDGGVDIFAWRGFSDGRPGGPLLLVQCTIAKDFINKIGDIDIPLWSAWLSSDINPLAAVAVPMFVTSPEDWLEISTRGILFDRGRLIEMLGEGGEMNLPLSSDAYFKRLAAELRHYLT